MPSLRFTSLNVMTSLNDTVMSVWWTTTIEVTPLLKENQCSEMKDVQEKKIRHGCEG